MSASALRKLHARDRTQLVTLAYETGLVLPRLLAAARPGEDLELTGAIEYYRSG